MKPGDIVEVKHSTDGHKGRFGCVHKVFESGRAIVFIDGSNMLNFSPDQLSVFLRSDPSFEGMKFIFAGSGGGNTENAIPD